MRSPLVRTALGLVSVALCPNLAAAQGSDPNAQPFPTEAPTAATQAAEATPPEVAPTADVSAPAQAPSSSQPDAAGGEPAASVTGATSVELPVNGGATAVAGEAPVEAKAATSNVPAAEQPVDDQGVSDRRKEALGDDEPTAKRKPEVDVGLRVIGGFRYRKQELNDDAEYGFQLRQVRASLKLKLGKRLYTRLSTEFSDGIGSGSGIRFLRTAVLEYRQSKALRLAVGRFKRPFSYLQLQSTADLPVLDRGLLNSVVIEDSQWGDRGIGAMASGKFKEAHVGWALSLTNPAPITVSTQGIDVIARVTWSPLDLLTIGVNGGNKYLDFEEGRQHFQAVGGDITLHVGGLEWQLEGAAADRPWHQSVAFGATSLLTYTQRLSKNWQLQPTVFAEYADANSEYGRNESVRLQGGINAIVREQLRIMPQYKLTTSVGDPLLTAAPSSPQYWATNPWKEGYEFSLLISLVL